MARIGMPLRLKRVYVAETDVTYETNRTVENEPHENSTHGGDGAFALMLCWVTSQQDSRSSTCCCTSLEDGSSERSRNTSSWSRAGSLPVNFGGAPRVYATAGSVCQFADRLSCSWSGLNWNLTSPIRPPIEPPRSVGGWWMDSEARDSPRAASAPMIPAISGAPASVKPWCAISRVSVATAGLAGSSVGPVHRTGSTSTRPHWATVDPSARNAAICAVGRVMPVASEEIQAATFAVSGVRGRVRRMVENVTRVGSCQTKPLLPPSRRCSTSTSEERPSQPLNRPRSWPSIVSLKKTVDAGSSCVGMRRVSRVGGVGVRVLVSGRGRGAGPRARGRHAARRAGDARAG